MLALAYALVRESRYAEAAELFGALVEQRPREPAALYGAALATFNTGHAAEAEPLAQRAADFALGAARTTANVDAHERKLRAADALVLLAVVQAVRGDNSAALKTVSQAVALGVFLYSAFEWVTASSEEVRSPELVPRGMLASLGILFLRCSLAAMAMSHLLSAAQLGAFRC